MTRGSTSWPTGSTAPTRPSTVTVSTPKIELVNIRTVAIGEIPELALDRLERGDSDPARALSLEREVIFDAGGKPDPRPARFYERDRLLAGDRIEGPAVIEQYDTTTVIPPGLAAEIDDYGNILIDVRSAPRHDVELATRSRCG